MRRRFFNLVCLFPLLIAAFFFCACIAGSAVASTDTGHPSNQPKLQKPPAPRDTVAEVQLNSTAVALRLNKLSGLTTSMRDVEAFRLPGGSRSPISQPFQFHFPALHLLYCVWIP